MRYPESPASQPPRGNRCFEVCVGHTTIHVEGETREDAISEARRRLCRELPRLWDVISKLSPLQFQVRPI